jgi:hypothetical protein
VAGFLPWTNTASEGSPPNQLKAWTAPAGTPGAFRSIDFVTTHEYISLYLSGQEAGGPVDLRLLDRTNHEVAPLGGLPRVSERWKRLNFHAAPGTYRLEVKKSETGSFSFTQPFTDTFWSRLTPRVLNLGHAFQIVGLGGWALVFVLSLIVSDPPPAGSFESEEPANSDPHR